MKNNLIYLFSLLPILSYCQITIQQSALPVVGDAWVSYFDNNPFPSINITPAGPGQTWDYSIGWSISIQPAIDNFIDPAPLTGFSLFPNSNIAEQFLYGINTNNYFFRNEPTGLYQDGSYRYDTSGHINKEFFTNSCALHVPFTYGSSSIDTGKDESITIYSPINFQPARKHISMQFQNFVCDAWGTLMTPCYSNPIDVIRIRSQRMGSIDSVFIDSSGTGTGPWILDAIYTFPNPSQFVDWNFFQNNSPCIVLSISTDSSIVDYASYFCDTILSGIHSNEISSHSNYIFPSPAAGDFVHFRIPSSAVKNIAIYNLSGSLVKELQASGISTINLSTDYFQNGIYFCVYLDGDKKKVYTEKFVVNK